MSKKLPHQTDLVVGLNIRMWRLQARMSQTELGNRLGVTFQQVQKYEKGANRVGASRLMQIADALGVPLQALFEGTESANTNEHDSPLKYVADAQALRLVRAFADIEDSALKRSLVNVVEDLASRQRPNNHPK